MNYKRIVSREEMQEIDRIAIEEYLIPGLILMENAGRAVAQETLYLIESFKNGNPRDLEIAIICGKGNNGGDGFVAARHLFNAGCNVTVVCLFPEDIPPDKDDAKINFEIIKNMKIKMHFVLPDDLENIRSLIKDSSIIIDAIFGTGLTRKLNEEYCCLIEMINSLRKTIVSVDIPSGLDANDGVPLGAAIKSTFTVTMGLPKKGFFTEEGSKYTGQLKVADIGIPLFLLSK